MVHYCDDVTDMFGTMLNQINRGMIPRKSEDASSPQQKETLEAEPFQKFILGDIAQNFVRSKPIDELWAAANVFHFFADTEDARELQKYNPEQCKKFLTTDGQWIGAYGAIAMRQIWWCVEKLKANRHTRRAFVSMGEMFPEDVNRPSCWNNIHFLYSETELHMHVYQRSLNVWGVMPYDCLVLTNILNFVAAQTGLNAGELHWTVGSLHVVPGFEIKFGYKNDRKSMMFAPNLLADPTKCLKALENVKEYL